MEDTNVSIGVLTPATPQQQAAHELRNNEMVLFRGVERHAYHLQDYGSDNGTERTRNLWRVHH